MSKETCVVVIPIHDPAPTPYELISFRQCFDILSSHPIRIVAPRGISLQKYKEVVPEFTVIFINAKWQSSLLWYNKLKRSRFFYNLFSNYDYLLTYELDAFVFRDEIDCWCAKGYDYIGAPWFEGYGEPAADAKIIGAGNSGFSLRRIKPIRQVLQSLFYKNPLEYGSLTAQLIRIYIKTPYRWLRNQMGENYTVLNNYPLNEDRFFTDAVPELYPHFKVAPVADSIKFSFEVKPDYLFKINGNALPMGCHAWWSYNLPFWKPFIESYGHVL